MKIKNLLGKVVRYWTIDQRDAACDYGILKDINKDGYLFQDIQDVGSTDSHTFIPRERMNQIVRYKGE